MFVGAALSGMFPWTLHVPAAALLSLATSHGRTYRVRWEGGGHGPLRVRGAESYCHWSRDMDLEECLYCWEWGAGGLKCNVKANCA
jgi:hypothetical protein